MSQNKKEISYTLLKAGIASIPILGGAASEILPLLLKSPIEKRKEFWLKEVGEKLKILEKSNTISLTELSKNDIFIDTIIRISTEALKTSEQEKVALIDQSDVFVMPSVVYKKSVEGFGITYIEAASYGKPSIGGIYGGEGDAIKSGQTGYLCNGNDLNVLYDTLLKILTNDHHKELGKNALEFSKNFNWNKIIKKYIELI